MSNQNLANKAGSSKKSNEESIKARCLVQQCFNANLKIKPDENSQDDFVEIGRGAVFFVCFLKGAETEDIEKLVKSLINAKLTETDDEKHVSIVDLPGDVLIVPQATLGGKMKGKSFQYHYNVDKDKGKQLYDEFVNLFEKSLKENTKWLENDCKIKYGTYGIRQVYSTQTNGPYLHLIES